MLKSRTGIAWGLISITLIASSLIAEETSANTSDNLLKEPFYSQTLQSTEPSIKMEQLYSAYQPAKTQKKQQDDQYPAVLEALRNKARKQTAEADFRLAQYYAEQKLWRRAEPFMLEAIQLQPNHIGYLKMATQVAYDQKHYRQAEKYIRKAIQLLQQQPEINTQQLLNLKDNLAVIYIVKGQYHRAKQELKKTLEIRYLTLADSHPDIAKNLAKLGTINVLLQDLKQAEQQLNTALVLLQSEEKQNTVLIDHVKHSLEKVKHKRSQLDKADMTLQ